LQVSKRQQQGNQYDKIFRENLDAVIPGLLANVLRINAVISEELSDSIQHTKERKPDVLRKIMDREGKKFIVHIEFQISDESLMVYRMAEYYIMLLRKFQLPVLQYVIFLGSSKPRMPVAIETKWLKFCFQLISFSEIDYRVFLKSSKPEEVILGILADLEDKDSITDIVQRVVETSESEFAMKRYFIQLRILAQLRNLTVEIEKNMESISTFFDEEKDIFVIRAKRKFVHNLLTKTEHPIEQIADIAGVSLDFVLEIKKKLSESA
jgi:hypothetical protein